MSTEELPRSLNESMAVQICLADEIGFAVRKLREGVSVLFYCDKQMAPYLYKAVRDRLKEEGLAPVWIDGRAVQTRGEGSGAGLIRSMLTQLTEEIRDTRPDRVLVLPHLDLLVGGSSAESLSADAREAIPVLYENPRAVFLGFCDPVFTLNPSVASMFAAKRRIAGIRREHLPHLITESEMRKFPAGTSVYSLYKHLSGCHPLRVRQILSRIQGLDYPPSAEGVIQQIREMTAESDLELPNVDLNSDVAGYADVKNRLQKELLSLLSRRDSISDAAEIKALESLLPRGIIFYGPPGTGKTWFAKAMASSLNATLQVVSGPELKSMWLGQSEENLRKVFHKARQSAPSIIVFDELDSFASSRSGSATTQVNHSMVNQLLTEMDGFRKEELVFVVGTTNFVEGLDSALLRPGRFELLIPILAPELEDRLAILELYNQKLDLGLSSDQLSFLSRKTGETTDPMTHQPYCGDHLNSICRYLKRLKIRESLDSFEFMHLRDAMRLGREGRRVSDTERKVIAYHEAGHALLAYLLKDASPVELVSIDADFSDALGYVRQALRENPHVIQRKSILADLTVLLGGREAELLVFGDVSVGAENDLERATEVARAMVTRLGMSDRMGVRVMDADEVLSAEWMQKRDEAIDFELHRAQSYARRILTDQKSALLQLGETLLQRSTLEGSEFEEVLQGTLKGRDNGTIDSQTKEA